jgi:alpha-mannosidase
VLPDDVAAELTSCGPTCCCSSSTTSSPARRSPGCTTTPKREHARVAARLEELIAAALARLGVAEGEGHVLANAASHDRVEVVSAPDGAPVVVEVPATGVVPFASVDPSSYDDRVVTTEHSMANGQLAVHWDLDGTITSIIDVVRGRELLPAGRTIDVELAPDQPVEYDAWDLESWTAGLGAPIAGDAEVVWLERGPLRARVQVRRRFGRGSTMSTTATLAALSSRLDLEFDVDWHEQEQLLSLMVPLDVRADAATCDIQFGHVRRPTHPSSPWDAAKFEVCAHRFVDLAEPGFGVAVLNDGRFGHRLFDGGVRVSLLRGARYPDPDADQGRHRVTCR